MHYMPPQSELSSTCKSRPVLTSKTSAHEQRNLGIIDAGHVERHQGLVNEPPWEERPTVFRAVERESWANRNDRLDLHAIAVDTNAPSNRRCHRVPRHASLPCH